MALKETVGQKPGRPEGAAPTDPSSLSESKQKLAMATHDNKTSRRSVLGALAVLPAVLAAPAIAQRGAAIDTAAWATGALSDQMHRFVRM